jgi:hypothetical protein
LFIAVPLSRPKAHRAPELRRHKGDPTAVTARFQKPATSFPARAFQFLDDDIIPVICPTGQVFFAREWFDRGRPRHNAAMTKAKRLTQLQA